MEGEEWFSSEDPQGQDKARESIPGTVRPGPPPPLPLAGRCGNPQRYQRGEDFLGQTPFLAEWPLGTDLKGVSSLPESEFIVVQPSKK